MEIKTSLLFGHVTHKRLAPRVNAFRYQIYYLLLPLSKIGKEIETGLLTYNRFGLLSFYDKDHGNRDGSNLNDWAKDILHQNNRNDIDGEIILITMPRIFGYVFNPVSFYLCHDKRANLKAVICEVNNTFGETHSYLCAPSDKSIINEDDWLHGQKLFHVSPFIERQGHYNFRFAVSGNTKGIWINLDDEKGTPLLLTSVTGKEESLSKKSVQKAFWNYPLMTFKAIFLIHWQAVKLLFKGTRYVHKPLQHDNNNSHIGIKKKN